MSEETQEARSTDVETRGETFTLTIDLGNEAMHDSDDISDILCAIAYALSSGRSSLADGSTPILDRNGNTVGSWQIR